jgi:hypothetical protein
MIEEELVHILSQDATVSGIVATRIYPVVMPTGTQFPALVYQRISTPRWNTLDNASDTPHARFAFSCWGPTQVQVEQLAAAVMNVLAGYTGTDSDTGITIQSCYLMDERDTWLWESGEETGNFRHDLDFEIAYTEPT